MGITEFIISLIKWHLGITFHKNWHPFSTYRPKLRPDAAATGAFIFPNIFRLSLTVIFICAWLMLPWLALVLRQQMCAADSVSSALRFPLSSPSSSGLSRPLSGF